MKFIFEDHTRYVLLLKDGKKYLQFSPGGLRVGDWCDGGEIIKVYGNFVIDEINKHGERYL